VHSFDGSEEELHELLAMDLFIGINGCSLRTPENLANVAQIPVNRIMLETDAPWCSIKRTHPSFKSVQTHWPTVKKERYVPITDGTGVGPLVKVRKRVHKQTLT
jgi:TatD DNase family protein